MNSCRRAGGSPLSAITDSAVDYAAPMYRAQVLGPMHRISRGHEAQVRDVADARSPEG